MPRHFAQTLGATRAIVAALVSAKAPDTDERIRILQATLALRGVEVVGLLVQRRGVSRSMSPSGAKRTHLPLSNATVIGSGKVQELLQMVRESDASVVYFLNALSTAQVRRLAAVLGCTVFSCPDTVALTGHATLV